MVRELYLNKAVKYLSRIKKRGASIAQQHTLVRSQCHARFPKRKNHRILSPGALTSELTRFPVCLHDHQGLSAGIHGDAGSLQRSISVLQSHTFFSEQ